MRAGAIVTRVARSRLICASLLVLGVLLPLPALAASAPTRNGSGRHTLLQSSLLWATIDVCNPSDQPDTVGIRGSMPGDGQSHDRMYMRFRLQYFDSATNVWVDLGTSAESGFIAVGAAKAARQAGRSFKLMPIAGQSAFELRGVVNFQWRRGTSVVQSASRPTTAPHRSFAGADPASFSAATCSIA
jgi:hypothetical protein